ncbi:hypothetical protein D3C80_1492700 [compost metagenome]
MVDIGDFGCSFRADVTELELANTASQHLIACRHRFFYCFLPGIVPAMAEHGGRNTFSRLGQQEIRRAVRRVPLQYLADQGAQAAFDPIHLEHDPQLLVGLLLFDAEGFILDVIPSHHQHVRRTLARQISQVHGILQLTHRFCVNRFPDRIVRIEVPGHFLVLANALTWVLFGREAPFPRHVVDVR